jgi:hypothetical protein
LLVHVLQDEVEDQVPSSVALVIPEPGEPLLHLAVLDERADPRLPITLASQVPSSVKHAARRSARRSSTAQQYRWITYWSA